MATAVLVGRYADAPADINTLPIGTITVIDELGKKPSASSKSVSIIKIAGKTDYTMPDGSVKNMAVVEKAGDVTKEELAGKVKVSAHKPAVEQSMEFDFTGATFNAEGQRVALRIIMGDNEGFKVRLTKTFEIFEAGLTPEKVAEKLAKRVNKSFGDVIRATNAGEKLTLKALPCKIYAGTERHSGYFQNSFGASVYTTGKSTLGNVIAGVVLKDITAPFQGIGTYELVRDRERETLIYRGNRDQYDFTGGFPRVTADPAKTYDSLTFSYSRWAEQAAPSYLQNQTKSVEVYVEAGTGAALEAALKAMFAAPAGSGE